MIHPNFGRVAAGLVSMDFRTTIQGKLILAMLFMVLVPLVGTGLYGNWVTSRVLRERAVEAARNDVNQHVQQISGYLDGVRRDVLYLSRLDSLQRLNRARLLGREQEAEAWRAQLAQDFLLFSLANPMYYQIRYLDQEGRETVRINYDGRTCYIVPDDALQDKSHRYYFQETMRRPEGSVYISPLDLNRELGEIEIPYRPVVRYAAPVYLGSIPRGMVIVNLYARYFLDMLYEEGPGARTLYMVDQDGYYLVHPDPARLWGSPRDLDTGEGLFKDFPTEVASILSGEEGVYSTEDNVLVYSPYYPEPKAAENYWVVIGLEPMRSLFAPVRDFRLAAASILILAMLVSVAMSLGLSRQLAGPIRALQRDVERFAQGGEVPSAEVGSHDDEIGQLARAVKDMARTIRRHMTQLEAMNRAGQEIALGLDRQATMDAIVRAALDLLRADWAALRRRQGFSAREGEWEVLAEAGERPSQDEEAEPRLRPLFEQAVHRREALISPLDSAGRMLSCAPLGRAHEGPAVLEVRGSSAALAEPATANLLATLAAQATIALENVALYEALAAQRQRLADLVENLITAQEEERKLVAYDLHDGLIQYLVGARLHLRNFTRLRERDPASAESALETGMAQLAEAIGESRRVIEGLRPSLLDDLGLEAAIRELAHEMAGREGWQLELHLQPIDRPVPPAVEITAFRIMQEALTNVGKHARAKRVSVRLAFEDGNLVGEVRDWGRGFAGEGEIAARQQRCVGLVGMQERARLVGGECRVWSQAGAGTRVTLRLSLDDDSGMRDGATDTRTGR